MTTNKTNILDSMPDTWGRKLMRRRVVQTATEEGKSAPNLYDIDYLMGVNDETRKGGLRFKIDSEGPFLDNNPNSPVPPITSIRELQFAAEIIESDVDSEAVKKWLAILIAPGSSLGGARPKANVIDQKGDLWIAKFPAKGDNYDKAAWEYLAYQLAIHAGIHMSYDINPLIEKNGLALNIDVEDNGLDFELARSVGSFFQLNAEEMDTIINQVKSSVKRWKQMASEIGIPKAEIEMMGAAFRY